MLRESSTSTAIMFCCGFNSAMVIAGCQSSISRIATIAVCRPQISQTRQPRTTASARARRSRIRKASPAAASTISSTSIHFGQAPRNANWPRAYTERGYLKKNSNINPLAHARGYNPAP